MTRTIAVITTSRADYGHLYWPLRDLSNHESVDLKIIALGAHLSPEFGNTIQEIRKTVSRSTPVSSVCSVPISVGMAKTIGLATLGLAEVLGQIRPDLLLLIADRYEMLAPASVALALRIPIAHIEGGEVSEGAIDDAVRNAVTKMSHIHFTSTFAARERVIAMGEEDRRVHRAGAPSLDHLRRRTLLTREEVEHKLQLDLRQPTILVVYHPVTIARDTLQEVDALFEALASLPDQLLFCYPNVDAGSRALIERHDPSSRTGLKEKSLQSARCDLLESIAPCRYVGWQFEQRHNGNRFICTAYNQRRSEAARARAREKCFGCGPSGYSRSDHEGKNPRISPHPGRNDESVRRWLRFRNDRESAYNRAPYPRTSDETSFDGFRTALCSSKFAIGMRIPLSAPDITEAEVQAVADVSPHTQS